MTSWARARVELHELNARQPSDRSYVNVARTLHGAGEPNLRPGTRTALILVHGYANPEEQAETAYRTHVARLESALAQHPRCALPEQRLALSQLVDVFALHWPGSREGWAMNVASFPARIEAANASGVLLGNALLDCTRPRVLLVAHSLGCRVALNALGLLHDAGRGPRTDAVLLAAAVPVGLCVDKEMFAVQPPATRSTVLHSAHDRVLQLTFPAGEGFHDVLAEAVGRFGRPDDGRWQHQIRTTLGHSDYWGDDFAAMSVVNVLLGGPRTAADADPTHHLVKLPSARRTALTAQHLAARWLGPR